jgi:hypothetical protein
MMREQGENKKFKLKPFIRTGVHSLCQLSAVEPSPTSRDKRVTSRSGHFTSLHSFYKIESSVHPKPYFRMVKLRRMITARQISAIKSAWAPSGWHARKKLYSALLTCQTVNT